MSETIVVTGATGGLGRAVLAELKRIAPDDKIVAVARNADKAKTLFGDKGVEIRIANYDDPAALTAAFTGADKALLISGSEVGRRVIQHGSVIEAAKTAGVKLLAYTSILHGEANPLGLAAEHVETERLLRDSGLPVVILRNGWYTENFMRNIPDAVELGTILGAAGEGRFSAAPRADFAAAAAAVLTSAEPQAGKVYELAGDESFTLAELAAAIATASGKKVVYKDLSEVAYREALEVLGANDTFAAMMAETDAKGAQGALFDDSKQLSALIGRPTGTLAEILPAALAAFAAQPKKKHRSSGAAGRNEGAMGMG